nr:transketolase C-terminal domain-containing protein [Marinitoga lauensis]
MGRHGDQQIIALYPSTVEEAYKYTIKAFNYAETYRTPVVLVMDETLGHMRESFYLSDEDENPEIIERLTEAAIEEEDLFHPFGFQDENYPVNPLIEMGKARFHVSGLVHDETGFPVGSTKVADKVIKHLDSKIRLYAEEIAIYDEYMTDDAEIIVVAYGTVARSAMKAVKMAREDRIPVGLFKPISIWPFPVSKMKNILKKSQAVIIAEMNLGQMALEISRINKFGKHLELVNKVDGDLISPREILNSITAVWRRIIEF